MPLIICKLCPLPNHNDPDDDTEPTTFKEWDDYARHILKAHPENERASWARNALADAAHREDERKAEELRREEERKAAEEAEHTAELAKTLYKGKPIKEAVPVSQRESAPVEVQDALNKLDQAESINKGGKDNKTEKTKPKSRKRQPSSAAS